MDLHTVLMAAFLGIVEGITEFLPVSSTGHLILVEDLLGFEGPPGKLFEIVIQLGAILSVCWLFRDKLMDVVRTLFRDRESQRFTVNITLAFLPAMVVGAFAYRFIKEVLFSPWVVAVALIVGGIAILIIERLPLVARARYDRIEDIPAANALKIGLFQCLSMIPGTSRAAATIMGALLVGVTRRAAAEFSFILAIPTMLAASVYDVYKNRATLTLDGLEVIAVGFVVAFLVALVAVKWMIAFISRHGFSPFAYYRIVVGAVMLAILFMRPAPVDSPSPSDTSATEALLVTPVAMPVPPGTPAPRAD
jgi:undecaprenyl-diphosphatase